MANIILGVTGSIAAYRAADIARELMRKGCTVRVCLTPNGQKFVTRVLFESLTGQPCLTWAFDEAEVGRMAHIDWARTADALLIAPATANIINKVAQGVADDMLSTLAVSYTGPMLIAPAMNPAMYANPTVQASLRTLEERCVTFIEPAEGEVACGEHGQGKLAAVSEIVEATIEVVARSRKLRGKKVLITSGPTRERIDSVRYLSNRSSGKMGAALAKAALLMGAEATVVSGPVSAAYPFGASVVRVESAQEMLQAALVLAKDADVIVGAAAVADYRVANPASGKVRRSEEPLRLELVPNPDVIAELAKAAPHATVVGFAAEPDPDLETARAKLSRKGLAAIAANDISRNDIGFESDWNELVLVRAVGEPLKSGKRSKLGCALWLFDQVISPWPAS